MFITFRLHGSLPVQRVFPPEILAQSGKAFVAMDRLLDKCTTGPMYLRRPEIARLVVAALQDGECKFLRYRLHAYVVMPNHVHLLVTPSVAASKWLAPLKGLTAYRANEVLGIHGHPFWQEESYDHLVRSEAQFDRIQSYIEENPAKAGLVSEASQHPWSSAASRLKGVPRGDPRPRLAAPRRGSGALQKLTGLAPIYRLDAPDHKHIENGSH